MKNYLCLIILTLSFNFAKANATNDVSSFHCQNTQFCKEAAQVCGKLAGINWGRKTCVNKTVAPHLDYVWRKEVTTEHCIGFLPIVATLNAPELYEAFSASYQAEFRSSFQASGCK